MAQIRSETEVYSLERRWHGDTDQSTDTRCLQSELVTAALLLIENGVNVESEFVIWGPLKSRRDIDRLKVVIFLFLKQELNAKECFRIAARNRCEIVTVGTWAE